jgi:hypothetical protein
VTQLEPLEPWLADAPRKLPSDIAYPARSIMTAPYTTDPASVVARRLRSSPFQGVGNFPTTLVDDERG